ncbi:uncharacterized protein LOC109123379 [Vitis vinifera]|uniref:uncharacterized protein LOC109123379 n=1 Tax=Vitis vinifera TaxID=29760 RepID=UPI0008FEC8D8|nr:uncharacterized protein LOC109123379 [Vitis vinifera]|eukprot:XP_019078476.1 PREDICTED: uncharacterized protein LOC109123379 [Vitis vinifera]
MQWFDERVLFKVVMEYQWEEVVDIIKEHSPCASVRITTSKDTALHLAVSDGREEILEHLVQVLGDKAKDALKIKNDHGNTPLHLAAALGNKRMCQCITDVNKDLVGQRNDDGHTPLFLTALYGKVDAFTFFCQICLPKGIQEYYRGARGESILHTAINGEHFKLALLILNNYEELMFTKDEKGMTPLHLLARKPLVFRSFTYFCRLENIVYSCKLVSNSRANGENAKNSGQRGNAETGLAGNARELPPGYKDIQKIKHIKEKHVWSLQIVKKMLDTAGNSGDDAAGRFGKSNQETSDMDLIHEPSLEETKQSEMRQVWSLQIVKKMLNSAGNSGNDAAGRFGKSNQETFDMDLIHEPSLEETKQSDMRQVWSLQIVKKMLNSAGNSGNDAAGRFGKSNQETFDMDLIHELPPEETKQPEMDRTETPILTAASNGIIEMVELILNRFPTAIYDKNSKKKNIVLLAAENRQPHLFDLLKHKKINETVFHAVDSDGNSALHLAANYNQSLNPWTIPGTALQMQWEIKWYEV